MEISDIKVLSDLINSANGQIPASLQTHPVDQIVFNNSSNHEALLNNEERKTYQELEEQLEEIREELNKIMHQSEIPNLPELIARFEDVNNNLNALSMGATFREGMLNGFRLAQFFLQGVHHPEASTCKPVK